MFLNKKFRGILLINYGCITNGVARRIFYQYHLL